MCRSCGRKPAGASRVVEAWTGTWTSSSSAPGRPGSAPRGRCAARASSRRPASSSSTPTTRPGGAWQHRWPSLTVGTTHRVHDLPGLPFEPDDRQPARRRGRPRLLRRVRAPLRPAGPPAGPRARRLPHRRRPVPRADRRRRLDGAGDRQRHRHLDPARSSPATPARSCSAAASCTPSTTAPPTSSPGSTSSWSAAAPRPRSCSARSRQVADTTWVTRRPPVWREGPFDEDARPPRRRPGRGGRPRGPPSRQRRRRHRAADLHALHPRRPRPRRPRAAADVRPDHRGRRRVGRTAGSCAPTSSSGPPASAPP